MQDKIVVNHYVNYNLKLVYFMKLNHVIGKIYVPYLVKENEIKNLKRSEENNLIFREVYCENEKVNVHLSVKVT